MLQMNEQALPPSQCFLLVDRFFRFYFFRGKQLNLFQGILKLNIILNNKVRVRLYVNP